MTTQPTVTTTATAASNVGSYGITASGAVDSNYTISYTGGTLTVNPVALTMTAVNQTKAYGAALPTLTASYAGFVNGDTAASLTTQPTLSTTATAASHVGSYAITATGAVDSNYTISYTGGTLTVNPVALTVTASNQTKAYGAALPTLTVSYSGFVNGDTSASLTTQPTVTTTATASSAVGTYPITASGAADSNYTISYVAGTLTVSPASLTLTITADNQTKAYGAALPTLTVSYAGFVNGDTSASLTTQPTISTTATAASSVGTYPITASGAVDSNYAISYTAGTLTVNPVALTITAVNQTKAYGAALPTFSVSYAGFVNGDTSASLTTQPTVTTTATAASHVGTYPLTATGAVDSNYTISYTAGTLTVNPVALSITANNQTKAYGAALPTLTASYTGFVNGDTSASLTTQPTISTTATASSSVGTYPITATGAVDSNYTISYTGGTLTVNPATLTLTITANSQTKLYGAALPALTVSYAGFVNGDTSASLSTQPTIATTATAASPVGTYPITASGAVDNNYAINYVAGTLTVNPVALTITVGSQTKAYGAALPTFGVTYSGFVNGDSSASLTTPPTITTTATAASHAGSYPITASGAVDSNYTISYTAGTLTVTPVALTIAANNQTKTYGAALPTLTASYTGFVNGDTAASLTTQPTFTTTATAGSAVGSYTIFASAAVDSDYTISYTTGTLTVTQAALTITANNQTKAYGAALPGLTVSYSGFVNGDTVASLIAPPGITTTATSSSPVGSYPITAASAIDNNYTITYVPGTLTVTAATLTLSITANNQTKAYGAALPTLTVSYAGFVNGDTASSLATQPTVTTTATAASPVGTYPITATGAIDNNYSISYVPGTLTVTPVALVVTANNQTKAYGAALPTLSVSYTGFVNGDTSASLTTQPTLSSTATAASHVGIYGITASGAIDSNYTISYVGGTLSVNPVALTITAVNQTKNYGAALPTLTASYTGFVNGDTAASLSTPPTVTTTATAASAVGTYPITAAHAVDNDYTISYVAGTLTVSPVGLVITANNQSKLYGLPLPTLTASYAGFVNGDTSSSLTTQPSLSTTATISSAVGSYPITATGAVDNNYTISYVAGTLMVAAIVPTQLLVTTQPALSVTAGRGSLGFAVTAEDAAGHVANTFTGVVTVSLGNNPGGSTLSGTLTATAVNGVATFSGLSLNKVGVGYTLAAAYSGLSSATTNSFSVTPAAAAQLIVSTQPPTSIAAGTGFGLSITAEDAYGNLATSFGGSVAVALASNPGSSTLGGIVSAVAI